MECLEKTYSVTERSNQNIAVTEKMSEDEVVKQLKEINDKLGKIVNFLSHDGLSTMLNEKLSSYCKQMTEILARRIDTSEEKKEPHE